MSILIKACKDISKITDNEELNSQNFLEATDYITNLNTFLKELMGVVPVNRIKFLPSFKGKYIVQKLGILATDKENEMKVFRVKSTLFLEDEQLLREIKQQMIDICEDIIVTEDVMIFYLP